ncbi:MAG: hypothetical protein MUO64_03150 [Anaerolineales bacterium]|nr:hypothetical protein [Anaerolineales bacterium]
MNNIGLVLVDDLLNAALISGCEGKTQPGKIECDGSLRQVKRRQAVNVNTIHNFIFLPFPCNPGSNNRGWMTSMG